MRLLYFATTLLLMCPALLHADTKNDSTSGISSKEAAEGFVPIFDGKSLDGWEGLKGSTDSY
ncbi:MAG: hypothetical protein U9N87_11535, partial [Planctomycetota bacterium]|nr:hypothetical protein [Planctomycetota bacterium]